MNEAQTEYDIAVIGGGLAGFSAGLIAAHNAYKYIRRPYWA